MSKKTKILLFLLVAILTGVFIARKQIWGYKPSKACQKMSEKWWKDIQEAEKLMAEKRFAESLKIVNAVKDSCQAHKCWVHYDEALALQIANFHYSGKNLSPEFFPLIMELNKAPGRSNPTWVRAMTFMAPHAELQMGWDTAIQTFKSFIKHYSELKDAPKLDPYYLIRPFHLKHILATFYYQRGATKNQSGAREAGSSDFNIAQNLHRENIAEITAFLDSTPTTASQRWQDTMSIRRIKIILSETYSGMGNQFSQIGEQDSAIKYHQEAIKVALPISDSQLQSTTYLNLGLAYHKNENYLEAEAALLEAISIYEHDSIIPKRNPYIGSHYASIGEAQLALGKYDHSLENFQKSLYHFSISLPYKAPFHQHPESDSISGGIAAVQAMGGKLKALLGRGTPEDLQSAIILSELMASFSEVISWAMLELDDKTIKDELSLFLSSLNKPNNDWVLKSAVKTPMGFNLTHNIDTVNYLIKLFEGSKSKGLYLELKNNLVKEIRKNGDDDFFEEYDTLYKNCSAATQDYFLEKIADTLSSTKLSQLKHQLNEDREQLEEWSDKLAINYPEYHRLRDFMRIQKDTILLSDCMDIDQALVSYIWSEKDSLLYSLAVYQDSIWTSFQPLDSLRLQIQSYDDIISSYSPVFDQHQLGYELYHSLIPRPLQNKLQKDGDIRLVISGDGPLYSFPFGALYTSPVSKGIRVDNFLAFKHPISQAFSLPILKEQNKFAHDFQEKASILAIAPLFGVPDEQNCQEGRSVEVNVESYLCFNRAEAENIKSEADLIYLNEKATINRFLKKINDYSILHFSTHAYSRKDQPDSSFIAFSATKGQASRWYYSDIQAQTFHPRLVTLSACNSAQGSQVDNEVELSLMRAFATKGTGSMLATLWAVNDLKSKEVMTAFYENLRKGETLDVALQNAMIDKIDAGKDGRNPYMWAPFILYGSTVPIPF